MKYILISIILLCLTGCQTSCVRTDTTATEQQQQKTLIENDVELEGEAAGVPFRAKIVHTGKQTTDTETKRQETKETSSPAASGLMGYIISIIAGGGLGGFAIKTLKDKMIRRVTEGIDNFIEEDAQAGEKLKGHLSKKLDTSDKALIKKVKRK